MVHFLYNILESFVFILLLLLTIASYTLMERRVMAAIQRRRGPNVVGPGGVLQPVADGLKLVFKEPIIPARSNKLLFLASPIFAFSISMVAWGLIPFNPHYILIDFDYGAIFLFAISSLGVYGVIFSGWSSNSKYALLGALRSSAQMISYELPIGFVILTLGVIAGSFNITTIVDAQQSCWYVLPLLPLFFVFIISGVAETNRAPFDLPEGESEIASGYNVEYSGIAFALFFLAEYSNMLLFSALISLYFFGGWHFFDINIFAPECIMSFKTVVFAFLFVLIRATLPRYRYDQLLMLSWKVLLPVSFSYFLFIVAVLEYFDGFAGTAMLVFDEVKHL